MSTQGIPGLDGSRRGTRQDTRRDARQVRVARRVASASTRQAGAVHTFPGPCVAVQRPVTATGTPRGHLAGSRGLHGVLDPQGGYPRGWCSPGVDAGCRSVR